MAEATPLDATFGWLYIGMTIAMALWGVGAVQTWWYYDNYPNDPRILKGTVALTFICDTIHQILITYAIYIYVIKNFGDTEFATSVDWSLYVEILFNAFTAFFVQSFFTWRIWTLWKNIPLTVGIVLLVLSALGTSIAFVAQGMSQKLDTFEKFKELQALSMSVNVTAAVTDIAICIAMCVLLNASKTGFSWSNHIINRLMLFAINSGILTAACATASLIFILALPNTLVYFCFYLTIGRLYTNSILATLNARAFIRNGGRSTESEGNSRNMPMQDRNPRQHRAQNSTGAGITVQIETTRDYDDKFTSGGLRESTRSDENVKGYPLAV